MKSFKTRAVSPAQETAYWTRAEDCWALAKRAFEEKRWTGCTINLIHSLVALADLMCIRFSGKRYAGTSHDEAVDFYAKLAIQDPEFRKNVHRLGQIVASKTEAEYGGSPITENGASQMMKSAERFREYVLAQLGRR